MKHPSGHQPVAGWNPVLLGTACALASAVVCTAANTCLRAAAHCDPFWVSCIKAAPTMLLAGGWLLWRWQRRQASWPGAAELATWIVVGLVTQLLGNVAFQYGLGLIGLAVTVPLTFGTVIVGGALLGRAWLGEPITRRAAWAMALLSGAIGVLSFGPRVEQIVLAGEEAGAERTANRPALAPTPLLRAGKGDPGPASHQRIGPAGNAGRLALGVAAACVAGLAYALLGVVLRRRVDVPAPLATMLFIISTTGVVSLGFCSLLRVGLDGLEATPARDFTQMWWAGVFNAVAFFALSKALEFAPVAHVNVVNSTQTAFSAVAGIFIFGEAFTPPLAIGIAMTLAGLILLDHGRNAQPLHRVG